MLIPVEVSNLFFTEIESSGVTLVEKNGTRKLKIIVGDFEAQAIALGLENIRPPRPLTHDLLISMLNATDIHLEKLVVTDLRQNTYYAEIYLEKEGLSHIIDARPSDGIALAVRLGTPIFVEERVFEKTYREDVLVEEEPSPAVEKSLNTLESKLKEAVDNEEYELAADIRDRIRRLKER